MFARQSTAPGRAILGLSALGLALALSLPALASETPNRGPATETPAQSAESIQAPVMGPLLPENLRLGGPLEPVTLSPVDELDRGSTFTDAGLGLRAEGDDVLNAIERAKLDMARAAVEASRAAGTLYVMGPQPGNPADLDALRAAKDALQQSMPPAAVPSTPGLSGIGAEIDPIQLVGPTELSPAELEKLNHSYPAQSAPELSTPTPARPADEAPATDPDRQAGAQEVK